MFITKHYCDICGAECKLEDLLCMDVQYCDGEYNVNNKKEICPQCFDKIRTFVNNLFNPIIK